MSETEKDFEQYTETSELEGVTPDTDTGDGVTPPVVEPPEGEGETGEGSGSEGDGENPETGEGTDNPEGEGNGDGEIDPNPPEGGEGEVDPPEVPDPPEEIEIPENNVVSYYNGNELLFEKEYPIDDTDIPAYEGDDPVREATETHYYVFTNWLFDDTNSTEYVKIYLASFNELPKPHAIYLDLSGDTVDEFYWMPDEDEPLSDKTLDSYDSEGYRYTFASWMKDEEQSTNEEFVYVPVWDTALIRHVIYRQDDTVLYEAEYFDASKVPEYVGDEPSVEETETTYFTFDGWIEDEENSTEATLIMVAQITERPKIHLIYNQLDDTLLEDAYWVPEGEIPAGRELPSYSEDGFKYIFGGWKKDEDASTETEWIFKPFWNEIATSGTEYYDSDRIPDGPTFEELCLRILDYHPETFGYIEFTSNAQKDLIDDFAVTLDESGVPDDPERIGNFVIHNYTSCPASDVEPVRLQSSVIRIPTYGTEGEVLEGRDTYKTRYILRADKRTFMRISPTSIGTVQNTSGAIATLYTSPDRSSAIVKTIANDETVEIFEEGIDDNGKLWLRVGHDTDEGYIPSEWITNIRESREWKEITYGGSDEKTPLRFIRQEEQPDEEDLDGVIWVDTSNNEAVFKVHYVNPTTSEVDWCEVGVPDSMDQTIYDPNHHETSMFGYINKKIEDLTGGYGTYLRHKANELRLIHITLDERDTWNSIVTMDELLQLIEEYEERMIGQMADLYENELGTDAKKEEVEEATRLQDEHTDPDGDPGHISSQDVTRWNSKAPGTHTHELDGRVTITGDNIIRRPGTFINSNLYPPTVFQRVYEIDSVESMAEPVTEAERTGKYNVGNILVWSDPSGDYKLNRWFKIVDPEKLGTEDYMDGVVEFGVDPNQPDYLWWRYIANKPTTVEGFGLSEELYTKLEIATLLEGIENNILVLGKSLDRLTQYNPIPIPVNEDGTPSDKLAIQVGGTVDGDSVELAFHANVLPYYTPTDRMIQTLDLNEENSDNTRVTSQFIVSENEAYNLIFDSTEDSLKALNASYPIRKMSIDEESGSIFKYRVSANGVGRYIDFKMVTNEGSGNVYFTAGDTAGLRDYTEENGIQLEPIQMAICDEVTNVPRTEGFILHNILATEDKYFSAFNHNTEEFSDPLPIPSECTRIVAYPYFDESGTPYQSYVCLGHNPEGTLLTILIITVRDGFAVGIDLETTIPLTDYSIVSFDARPVLLVPPVGVTDSTRTIRIPATITVGGETFQACLSFVQLMLGVTVGSYTTMPETILEQYPNAEFVDTWYRAKYGNVLILAYNEATKASAVYTLNRNNVCTKIFEPSRFVGWHVANVAVVREPAILDHQGYDVIENAIRIDLEPNDEDSNSDYSTFSSLLTYERPSTRDIWEVMGGTPFQNCHSFEFTNDGNDGGQCTWLLEDGSAYSSSKCLSNNSDPLRYCLTSGESIYAKIVTSFGKSGFSEIMVDSVPVGEEEPSSNFRVWAPETHQLQACMNVVDDWEAANLDGLNAEANGWIGSLLTPT